MITRQPDGDMELIVEDSMTGVLWIKELWQVRC